MVQTISDFEYQILSGQKSIDISGAFVATPSGCQDQIQYSMRSPGSTAGSITIDSTAGAETLLVESSSNDLAATSSHTFDLVAKIPSWPRSTWPTFTHPLSVTYIPQCDSSNVRVLTSARTMTYTYAVGGAGVTEDWTAGTPLFRAVDLAVARDPSTACFVDKFELLTDLTATPFISVNTATTEVSVLSSVTNYDAGTYTIEIRGTVTNELGVNEPVGIETFTVVIEANCLIVPPKAALQAT